MVLSALKAPLLWIKSRSFLPLVAAFVIAATLLSSSADAHKEHRQQQQAKLAAAAEIKQAVRVAEISPEQIHENMGEMMDPTARSGMSSTNRLLDWLGRFHPILVHFPIAFFPAALFTAIVGRKRPSFGAPVQFLVVAGGILAPISALLGWFNGGWEAWDVDPLLAVHRWLGTGIGAGGLLLGAWAWRWPDEDRSKGMIFGLSVMTVAIAVQGWLGGALVHGSNHLNW